MMLFSFSYGDQEIDSTNDEIKVKESVVLWADSTFYEHSNYKFEKFHAFYTDEYFIMVMRAEMFKDRLDKLLSQKENGTYDGNDEEFENDKTDLERKYSDAKNMADNYSERVEYFQISFWSNIKTNDGITVYYEHILKLDNEFKVFDVKENSAIGKKSSETKILYKKDIKN